MIPVSVGDYLGVMATLCGIAAVGIGIMGWGVWCMIRDRAKY